MQCLLKRLMIQITPHMRILVAVEPVDFRAGIDGLVAACGKRLEADPFSGGLFIFCNRAHTGIKILVYDGQGTGRLRWRNTAANTGSIFNAQRCTVAWSTKTPRSCIISSMWLRLNG